MTCYCDAAEFHEKDLLLCVVFIQRAVINLIKYLMTV